MLCGSYCLHETLANCFNSKEREGQGMRTWSDVQILKAQLCTVTFCSFEGQ